MRLGPGSLTWDQQHPLLGEFFPGLLTICKPFASVEFALAAWESKGSGNRS